MKMSYPMVAVEALPILPAVMAVVMMNYQVVGRWVVSPAVVMFLPAGEEMLRGVMVVMMMLAVVKMMLEVVVERPVKMEYQGREQSQGMKPFYDERPAKICLEFQAVNSSTPVTARLNA